MSKVYESKDGKKRYGVEPIGLHPRIWCIIVWRRLYTSEFYEWGPYRNSKFETREEAQEKLDKLAAKFGWAVVPESGAAK